MVKNGEKLMNDDNCEPVIVTSKTTGRELEGVLKKTSRGIFFVQQSPIDALKENSVAKYLVATTEQYYPEVEEYEKFDGAKKRFDFCKEEIISGDAKLFLAKVILETENKEEGE